MTKLIKHRINALEIENAELRNATSLRDEFAMAALTGLASAVGTPPSIAAIEAYAFADAMLKTIEDTLQEQINVKSMVD